MDKDIAKPGPFKLASPGRADWQVDSSGSLWAGLPNYPGAIVAMAWVVKGEVKLVPGPGGAMGGLEPCMDSGNRDDRGVLL